MSVMTAFDPVRRGDFHLRAGMDLLAEEIPRTALCQMNGTNLADIAEHLAHGAGIAQVSPESQVTPFRENGHAFWEKWR